MPTLLKFSGKLKAYQKIGRLDKLIEGFLGPKNKAESEVAHDRPGKPGHTGPDVNFRSASSIPSSI